MEDPDGTGLHLIPADIYVEYPALSTDGTKIAFMSQEPSASGNDPDYNIYVMNADGTGITRLTDTPGEDGFPSWSRTATRSPSRPPATTAPTPTVPTA